MIIFEKLRGKNFLSVGSAGIEYDLVRSNLTLITAENGSGKSTAMDLLCFVLYGKAYRNISKPQLVNSINGKQCEGEVTFSTGGTRYRVIRGIKPNKFEIYENDNLLNQNPNVRDYQDILETQILKMNYTAFTQVVVMGSTNYIPFMRLKAADRRDFIESLLDIKIFSVMGDLLKNRVQTVKDDLKTINSKLESIQEKIELQKSFIASKISDKEIRLKQMAIELEETEDKKIEYEARYQEIEVELEDLQEQQNTFSTIQEKLNDMVEMRKKISRNLEKYETEKDTYENITTCPTCKQELLETAKEKVLEKYSVKISEFESGIETIKTKMEALKQKLIGFEELNSKIHALNREQSTINQGIHGCNILVKKIQRGIDDIETAIDNGEEEKLKLFEKDQEDLLTSQFKVREESHYLTVIQHLLKDSGIKSKIISQYIPIINKLVNKYLGMLDFWVSFNLDEQFNEVIKSRHRDQFTYDSFSAGEKQRIDIALMLTWREIASLKNSASTNLLFLDEILDASLDATVLESLMHILETMRGSNIFVISHREGLQDRFRSVIRLEKRNNFTVMV